MDISFETFDAIYPGATGTFSKGRPQFPENAPLVVTGGRGAYVHGSDGRQYLDWSSGLAAVSLGSGDEDVSRAICNQSDFGSVFLLPTIAEFEYATALGEILPWEESAVKFGQNGSDATEFVVRAAQYITGRKRVMSVGYHGSGATFCPNRNGIPIELMPLISQGSDWHSMDQSDAACVIVEPDLVSDLAELRRWCDVTGALLIFDEMLTGFRTPGFWYSRYIGVTPDFITAGKAINNGAVPFSVIAGRRDLMRCFGGDIGFSMTHNGNALAVAAARATLKKYQQFPVIDRLWTVGGILRTHWNATAERLGVRMPVVGQNSRLVIDYPSLAHRTLVSQEFFRRGIAVTTGFTPNFAHSDADVVRTMRASDEVLATVASVDDPLRLIEGRVIAHPYRAMTA